MILCLWQITNSGFECDLSNPQAVLSSTNDWINDSITGNAHKEELAGMVI